MVLMQQIPLKPDGECLYIHLGFSMLISNQEQTNIVKKWDNALKSYILQTEYRYKISLQKKLEIFPLHSKKRDQISERMQKHKLALIERKKIYYQKMCDKEISNIGINPPKKKKSRAKTHNGQLDKLLTLLQKYVRLRDSDHRGYGVCISCNKKVHYKHANGGHYYDRSYKSVCIQLTNINLQCQECNSKQSTGDTKERMQVRLNYRIGLVRKYGNDAVDVLDCLVRKEKSDPSIYGKIAIYDIDEWIIHYTPLVKKMEKEKCDISNLQNNK